MEQKNKELRAARSAKLSKIYRDHKKLFVGIVWLVLAVLVYVAMVKGMIAPQIAEPTIGVGLTWGGIQVGSGATGVKKYYEEEVKNVHRKD